MAQGKAPRKERASAVSAEETQIINRLAQLAKVEKKTETQSAEVKTLRAKLAPMRFVRLARQRVPRALKAIESIGKLTGSGYTHTEEQAKKILALLDARVEAVRVKLAGEAETAEETLDL